MSRPALTLRSRAIGYLAQREHSRVELRRKLLDAAARQQRLRAATEGGAPPDALGAAAEQEVDALLDWLTGKGLLSAERFVESRIHARAPRYGNLRIRQELAQHGVALEPDAADALQASELDRARTVWAKRYGGVAPDAAGRARQARFLTARGFSSEVVRRVVAGRSGD
ncbi:MAG TPA: regulatory protein RecX [Methylibium sp.]|nr:regulatory protein RecX [Methylibium sp.]